MRSSRTGSSTSSCGSSSRTQQQGQQPLDEQGNPTTMSNYSRMMTMEREASVPSLRSLLHRAHSHPATTFPGVASRSSRFLDILSLHSSSEFSFNTTDSIGASESSTSLTIAQILDSALELTERTTEESAVSSILNIEEEDEEYNQGATHDSRNPQRRRRTTALYPSRKYRRGNQDRSMQ